MSKILIVEDIASLREVLSAVLKTEDFSVETANDAEQALTLLRQNSYDCVLSDYRLPAKSGLDLLRELRSINPSVPFLLMTAFGSIEIAVEAMKLGATDFISKPFDPSTLCTLLHQVIEHRRIVDRASGAKTRRQRTFMTRSPAVLSLLTQARKVAMVDSTAFILGESGTGKELFARYIHDHSERRDKPFVAINCAAMPETLLESEFFGHEAGAFTGATQARQGLFEYASEGTVFLDEVGDMPAALQVKLLRALQEREIKRVGGTKTIKVNPRIIAATNRDLQQSLSSGMMREDFYYRLAVITFTLPALRERPQDIESLTDYFLESFCHSAGQRYFLSDEAWLAVRNYQWPGNARELENAIERATVLSEGEIRPEHLGINMPLDISMLGNATPSLTEIAQRAARDAEISLISRTLERTKGNKSKAAQLLGVSYKTLLNKVRDYEIEPTTQISEASFA